MEFLKQETVDGTERNLDALYQLFPQCFTEAIDESDGKTIRRVVDFQKLRELLGDFAEDDVSEAYEFTWVGKNAAKREAARPIRKTLRPCEEESVDWETTKNLYIEGDNLEVLKLLQSAYMGKVKMIYIDPPYNTGNDFVYHDDFSMSQEDYQIGSGNIDEDGVRLRKNTATNGRFHSDWCSMIYSRLLVARSLLADDGIIFISINDYEVRNMKILCDEIYGEDNFIAQVCVVTGANQSGEGVLIQKNIEYCLVYGKNISQSILTRVDKTEESWRNLNDAPTPLSTRLDMGYTIYYNPSNKDLIPVFDYDKNKVSTNSLADVYKDDANLIGQGYIPVRPGFRNNKLHRWRWGIDTFNERKSEVCIFENKGSYIPKFKQCGYNAPKNIWYYGGGAKDMKTLFGEKDIFDYPKGIELIKYISSIGSTPDCIVLDFFSGSATTAHAVMQLNAEDGGNRRFIMVQLPEETPKDSEAYKAGYHNICEIGKERIRRAGKKVKEDAGLQGQDLDTGFRVLKLDKSNMQDVYFHPKDYSQATLDLFINNVKEGRSDLDLLFGCMLDWGVQLSLPLAKQEVDNCDVYVVNEGDMVACFSDSVSEKVIDAIAELMPVRVVFRDSCFADASSKMNLFELFKQKCGWSEEEARNNIRVI